MEFMQLFDTQSLVVPVIAVPQISLDRIPQRFVDRRRPQRTEQLVEVPTEPAFVEQTVGIPVLGGWGRLGHLQGFHPELSSTALFAEQHVDIPVPTDGPLRFLPGQGRFAVMEDLVEVFKTVPGQSSTAFCGGRGPGGGLQDFLPEQG